jgi:hypothetical protein
MKRFGEDLLVTAFGAATSLLTAFLLYGIERVFDLSVYTWMFWFVIPAGALLSGFAAATGYLLGARVLNHRPTKILLINMLGVSVGTFFLVHYLSYYNMEVQGAPIRTAVPFAEYLKIALTKVSMTFRFHAAKVGETGELGGWGYLYAVLQILGFAAGGFGAYAYLADAPYCEGCRRYFKRVKQTKRFTDDPDALTTLVGAITPLMEARRFAEVIQTHRTFGKEKGEKGDQLAAHLALYECTCSGRLVRFSVHKWNGSDWKEVPGTKQEAAKIPPALARALSP